jgi:heme oxygenase
LSSEHALAELRQTTRAEHERIDEILCLTAPMDLSRYAVIVCGFDAFLRAWEPRIHDALPERLQGWFRSRRRGGFAAADVEWLRCEAGVDPVAMDARAVALLPLTDLAEALGSLYVIEGSALGGRVIAPQLKRTLGLTQGAGASYFHGFGGESGVMWNNFRTLASLEIGESSRNVVRACESARRTFQALITMFEPIAPPAPAPGETELPSEPRIAPALLAALGAEDPEATRPASPVADLPIELPVAGEHADTATLVELPMDGDGGDTPRMPP